MDLDGRRILITGAGRAGGLGAAVARAAAERGARVIVSARRREDAEARAAELGAGATALALDIADPASIAEAVAEVGKGGLDVLVNNAAVTSAWGETAEAADLDAARRAMEVILYGTWAMCQAFLPLLRAAPSGRIVNVSSGAGSHSDMVFGLPSQNAMGPSYAVAKAALNALTHRLGLDLADTTIRVNAVCPGFTATFPGGAEMGARPPEESAAGVLWAATLPDDGPTGGFFRDGAPLGW